MLALVVAWLDGLVYPILLFGPMVVTAAGFATRLVGLIRGQSYTGLLRRPLAAESRPYLMQFGLRLLLAGLVAGAGWLAIPRSGLTDSEWWAVFLVFIVSPALVFAVLQIVPKRPVSRSLNLAAALVACFLVVQFVRVGFLSGVEDAVEIAPPFAEPMEGEWVVGNGGQSALINHHFGPFLNQRDALDLVVVGDDRLTHDGSADRLESYRCWGLDLLAPSSGIVVRAVGDQPDQPIGRSDTENLLGNHVVVDIGAGRYLLVAHLQAGSLAVAEGDQVAVGDRLGACGNSGNTSEPHIHMQIQDSPDFTFDRPIATFPVKLSGIVQVRGDSQSSEQTSQLRRNDIIRLAD